MELALKYLWKVYFRWNLVGKKKVEAVGVCVFWLSRKGVVRCVVETGV